MTSDRTRIFALLAAVFAAAALRLVPHPPNFSPIDAMALFSGAYLGRRWLAFVAPLGALLLSDSLLGFYQGMEFQYVSVALIVLLGWVALPKVSVLRLGGATVAGSVLFFAITNFGTWLTSGMYPHTLPGLGACFIAAIPFYQNTLAGDLVYAALLFGSFALAERLLPILKQGREPRPA
ncbi:MAG TPA: DUF6580 family putative transport protein [Sphingomicrobium sp.]|nr:DUF6580 family putative transport protein [Sphingomicrobium sp.]